MDVLYGFSGFPYERDANERYSGDRGLLVRQFHASRNPWPTAAAFELPEAMITNFWKTRSR